MQTDGLLALACQARSLADFRIAALVWARDALGADVGMLAVGGHRAAALVGFGAPLEARIVRRWEGYGAELAPVHVVAAEVGLASDVEVLGDGLRRTRVYRDVMAPLGGTESLFLTATFAGRKAAGLMLGRCGARFSRAERARVRGLGPALAVACAAAASLEPLVSSPSAASSPPVSLTPAERELCAYLELGYETKEIARARGRSFYTVRNQLSALYRKLGVTNRTEAVGLRLGRAG